VRLAAFPVSWLVYAAGIGALAATLGLTRDQLAGGFVGAMLAFAVFWGATLGASSVWLFGLLAVAIGALVRRADVLAGVLIGTAAALRVYPVVLLIPLVVAGRWWAIGSALAAVVGWTFIGVVIAGPEATRTFVDLLFALQGVDAGSSNVALGGAARWLSMVAGLAVLGWAGWLARSATGLLDAVLAWALTLAGMLLVTPVVWDHYTTALLPLVLAIMASVGGPVAGLLSMAMLPASLAGGYILVWLPVFGAAVALSRRRRLHPAVES
jgi:alpha-1,2-mannosyltransferase